MKINRRHMIMGATALTGSVLGSVFLPFGVFGQSPAMNKHEFELLSEVVDMIIPATDTPGAAAAGVPLFIDMMFNDWYSPAERVLFLAGLNDIDQRSPANDFLSCLTSKKAAILLEIDNPENEDYNFFRHLKELTLRGYYTSEIGASEELRYEAIPGPYRGCVPFEEIGRTWAT